MAPAPNPARPGTLFSLLGRGWAALEWVALCALSIALAAILALGGLAMRADNLAYDAFSRNDLRPADPGIVIVAIDNRSIAALGRWPWPRATHARAIETLAVAAPRAIVYDVLFVEPGPAAGDAALARAVAGSRVFLPRLLEAPGPNGAPYADLPPIPPLARAMAGSGQVVMRPDDDGVIRRFAPTERIAGRCWPHLMQAVHDALSGGPAACTLPAETVLIPFAGPAGQYPVISFASLVAGEVPPELLRGKIVLVGAAASGMGDRYATPMQGRADLMAGVEINANIMATLIRDAWRTPAAPIWNLLFALVPLALMWAGFLFLRPRGNLLLAALLLAGIGLTSMILLSEAGIWLRPAPAAIPILLFLPIWGWRRLAAASRYFIDELDRLRQEPGVLGGAAPPLASGDRIALQMRLLGDAVGQVRDLKHFIEESHASLPDATIVVAPDGHIVLANERAHDLCESTTLRRAEGDTAVLLTVFRQGIAEGGDMLEAIVLRLREGSTEEQECEIALGDGRALLFRIKTGLDAAGEIAFHIARFTDITELRTAARQRDQMLQFLTHDMRAPQASILALLRQSGTPETAARIERHARHTLDLADTFVHLARAESREYETAVVDLQNVAIEAADQLWDQAEARGIRIAMAVGEEELLVEGNAALLARAVANLIGNAVKYSPEGSTITVTVTRAEDSARIAIQDQGRGISPEDLTQLYTRFTRFGEAGNDGVGLGLVFVKTVAETHGGSISCTSTPGKGSCFMLTLPLVEG